VDVRRLARDERADLAAFLATLSPRQWQAPTLWRIRGVRVVATDFGFSAGAGPKVRGAAEALLMSIVGRRGVVANCPARAGESSRGIGG